MTGRDESPEIVKWYTRARKFPQLIGKTPDGAKLWGGPYTYTQVIGAAVVVVVGLKTLSLWGTFGLIGNALVVLGAAYGTALLLGRLPIGSRNPLSVGSGILHALSGPAQGSCRGAALRIRRPHRVRARLVIRHAVPTPAVPTVATGQHAEPQAATDLTPGPAQTPPPPPQGPVQKLVQPRTPDPAEPVRPSPCRPALTGVQRLLASTGANSQEN